MVAEHDRGAPRVAAFFDVDRTLLRGSSLLHVARPMRRAGFLRGRALLSALVVQTRFSMFGFDDVQIHEAVRGAGELVAGVESARLLAFAREAIPAHVLPRVYREAGARIAWHRARGHLVFLVSSSPQEFIEVLGELLGVDGVAATLAETVDGRCTGRILRLCHGLGKAQSVRELAATFDVDLELSYAYGDSLASDLAMLQLVGHPVCVNPDRRLAAHAQATGWPIERFRGQRWYPPMSGLAAVRTRVVAGLRPATRRARLHARNTARSLRGL